MVFFNIKNVTLGILALAGIFLISASIVLPLVGSSEIGESIVFVCPLH
jgi:hypothetical protein